MGTSQPAVGRIGLLANFLGLFLLQLDVSIVNVALSAIRMDLGGENRLPWVIDGYTLPIAALMLTTGTIGDRVGHKLLYKSGLVVFLAGTVACVFAPTIGLLIAARVLQGIGASTLAPASLALLVHAFPERALQQRAVGYWAAIGGLGFIMGPILGGVLTSSFGWASVFIVTAAATIVAFVAAGRLTESHEQDNRPIDVTGILAGSVLLAALVVWFIEGPKAGWTSPIALAGLGIAIASAAAFVQIEQRTRFPMLPLEVFQGIGFITVNVATILMTFGNLGFIFVYSIFLQQQMGLSPFQAGIRMLPISIALVTGSTFCQALVQRIGPRNTASLGLIAEAIALAALLAVGSDASAIVVVPILFVLGLGTGIEISSLVSVGVRVLPAEDAGLASAIVNTARQVGTALGTALIGSVYGSGGWSNFRIAVIIAIIAFVTGGLVVRVSSRPRFMPLLR